MGAGQEVIQGNAGLPGIRWLLGHYPKVCSREVAFRSVKTALSQHGAFYYVCGYNGGKAQDVGITIYGNAVQ